MEPIERCVKEFDAESYTTINGRYGLMNKDRTAMFISDYKPDDLEVQTKFSKKSMRETLKKLDKSVNVDPDFLKAFLDACFKITRRPIIRLSAKRISLYYNEYSITLDLILDKYADDKTHVYFDATLIKPAIRLLRKVGNVRFMWREQESVILMDIDAEYSILIAPYLVDV